MAVNVALRGPDAVRFVTAFQVVGDLGVGGLPADSFTLHPRREMLVDAVFDAARMDALPEGLNASQIFVQLTAGSIGVSSAGDGQIEIGLCEGLVPTFPTRSIEPPEIERPLVLTWLDCSSGTPQVRRGFPPVGWVLRSDGCHVPPPTTVPTVTLNFSFSQLSTVTNDAGIPTFRANLAAQLLGDDPTTYRYNWNFDALNQGSGTGNAGIATPMGVSWSATSNDRNLLRLGTSITRTIEVIATKGTTVLRARRQVSFAFTETGGGGGGGTVREIQLI